MGARLRGSFDAAQSLSIGEMDPGQVERPAVRTWDGERGVEVITECLVGRGHGGSTTRDHREARREVCYT